jgi:hypothetical protein
LLQDAERLGLLVGERLIDALHRRVRYAGRIEHPLKFGGRERADDFFDHPVKFFTVVDAFRIAAEARVLHPFGMAENSREQREQLVVSDRDENEAVACVVTAGGSDLGHARARRCGTFAEARSAA